MAKSVVEICNRALARIGVKQKISDLDSDQSPQAETANLFYADTRDGLLMEAPWPFATRRAVLALIDPSQEQPRDGWQYVYALPVGMLEPQAIWPGGLSIPQAIGAGYGFDAIEALSLQQAVQNPRTPRPDQRIPFSIEAAQSSDGDVLLCDYPGAHLIYTAQLQDVTKFSPLFARALEWKLAAAFAMPLSIKVDIAKWAEEMADKTMQTAVARHFQGQQEDMPPDSEMIGARY